MILFGFGPVWRAVIKILKAKIKQAEMAYATHKKELEDAHALEVRLMEVRLQMAKDAHLEEQVNLIFKGV